MKGSVGFDCLLGVPGAQPTAQLLIDLLQVVQVRARQCGRREAQGQTFEGLHHGVDLGGLCGAQRRDAGPAVEGGLDEAFVFQAAEGFADRCAADAELLGDILIAEQLFRLEGAVDDPGAELGVDLVSGQGAGAFRDGGWNRHPQGHSSHSICGV